MVLVHVCVCMPLYVGTVVLFRRLLADDLGRGATEDTRAPPEHRGCGQCAQLARAVATRMPSATVPDDETSTAANAAARTTTTTAR